MNELPPGWAETTLHQVADVRLGRQRSPKNHSGARMRSYLRAANVTWGGLDLAEVKEMNFTEEESAVYELRKGDVLVAEASGSPGEVGKPARWRGEIADCCFQNTLVRVRSKGPLSDYLHYFLFDEARSGRLGRAAPGVGIHHIGSARLSAWPLPLPPLAEQRRIVAAIEEQFSRLDAAASTLTICLRRLRMLRRTALDNAFERLPRTRLGEVAEVAGGHTPRGLQSTPNGTIPFFKVGDMNTADEDGRMAAARTYLSPEAAQTYRVRLWPSGTVIFPKQGGAIATNKKRVLATAAACDLNTMGVIPSGALDPVFARAWFETVDLSSLSDGSVVAQIKPSRVADLLIPLPPLFEQRRIVAALEQQLSLIDSLRAAVESAQRRSAALRRAILERALRGELVPQDPADEPASVLLERISADRAAAPAARTPRV